MRRTRRRHLLGVFLVGLVVLTAGCGGLFGGDDGSAGGPTVEPGYEFSEGESYTFNISARGAGASYRWDVVSVGDGQVTVNVTTSSGGANSTDSITATVDDVFAAVRNESALGSIFGLMHAPRAMSTGHELTLNNSWTVDEASIPEGSAFAQYAGGTMTITGGSTVAGTDCLVATIEPPSGEQTTTACLRADWPFVLSLRTDGSDGSFVVSEFTRP